MRWLSPRAAVMALVLCSALSTAAIAAVTAELDAVFLAVAVGLTIIVSLLASRRLALGVASLLAICFAFAHLVVSLGPLADSLLPGAGLGNPYLARRDLWSVVLAGAALLVATAALVSLLKPFLPARIQRPSDQAQVLPRSHGLRQVALEIERSGRYQRRAVVARLRVAAPTAWAQAWAGEAEPAPSASALVGALLRPHLRPFDLVVAYQESELILLLPETRDRQASALFKRLHQVAQRQLGCSLDTTALSLPAELEGLPELIPELTAAAEAVRRGGHKAELRAAQSRGSRSARDRRDRVRTSAM